MPRPIAVTISISALTHNLRVVRRHLKQAALALAQAQGTSPVTPAIWAVIKAHGYGHGIAQAVQGFAKAQGLAMLDLAEAIECREAGWKGPILLLEGFFDVTDLEIIDHYHLACVVHTPEQLDMLAYSKRAGSLPIFLKLNTGMNRLGFSPTDYRRVYTRMQALQQQGNVGSIGNMTQFANADGPQGIAYQYEIFQRIAGDLPGSISLANSAALLRYPEITLTDARRTSWVRPGICLYGASPFANTAAASLGLRPAMSLRSQIVAVQVLQPGDEVGYGGLFTASVPMRIGVVACGYADGYPRHAPTGTPVVVAGVRTRLVGRVSMDMLTVDLTAMPEVGVGAPVSLWGIEGPSVDEVAQAADTIGYELLCALAPRVPMRTTL